MQSCMYKYEWHLCYQLPPVGIEFAQLLLFCLLDTVH